MALPTGPPFSFSLLVGNSLGSQFLGGKCEPVFVVPVLLHCFLSMGLGPTHVGPTPWLVISSVVVSCACWLPVLALLLWPCVGGRTGQSTVLPRN